MAIGRATFPPAFVGLFLDRQRVLCRDWTAMETMLSLSWMILSMHGYFSMKSTTWKASFFWIMSCVGKLLQSFQSGKLIGREVNHLAFLSSGSVSQFC